ncbi:hypothetical protein [Sphingobacterium sp. 1.A.4]|uniref:hypothetical protein n=1 Tax=Sphingobacterium sp. 1.A.4 TaxID=2044603 RepID=UPI000C0C0F5E|nr:hypothetical protein [Sphingobacterium sp. 1.A.4]
MKKNNLKGFGLVYIILSIVIIYNIIYFLLILSKANESDKTLYDTVGNFLTLFINTLTIYFVYKTYASNKEDVQFNRTIDLFYKQLTYSEKRILNDVALQSQMEKFFKRVQNSNVSFEVENDFLGNDELERYSKVLKYISEDLYIYTLILERTNLTLDNKKFIVNLTIGNIYPNLLIRLSEFQNLYKNFKNSINYIEASERQSTTLTHNDELIVICNDIDFYLTIITGSVFLEIEDGLNLGE